MILRPSLRDPMPDVFSPEKRSEIMSRIRGRDTGLELRVRSALWRRGLRFQTQYGPYKIDVAFPRRRVAVFVDSCYFHGCPRHFVAPRTRTEFWIRKIERNRARDRLVGRELRRQGWTVLRLWGHDLRGDLSGVAAAVERAVRAGGPSRASDRSRTRGRPGS